MKTILSLLVVLTICLSHLNAEAGSPNFIVILADDLGYNDLGYNDLGYNDLGCYAANDVATPHIDQMAKDGSSFPSFYVSAVCSPTRASLLTGCIPQRVGIGDFLSHEPDDVTIGEDISCGNFFPIGDKWMLLCISHPFGCRYYLGDWDAEAEQFVPETHGRMNWRSDEQDTDSPNEYRNFFAPESLLTADGRRVMWAWLTTLEDNALRSKTIQSLPRELSLREDGTLRIEPLRELEQQRFNLTTHENIDVVPQVRVAGGEGTTRIAQLKGDAYEIRITIDREEAERKRFGFRLFTGQERIGVPIYFQPNNRTLRVGDTEAPFAISDLADDEDVELRIFIDKYLVEVFVNGRQAVVTADMDSQTENGFDAYAWGAPTTIRRVDIWKLKPTNQGYLEAQKNRIWEPDTMDTK